VALVVLLAYLTQHFMTRRQGSRPA
jgi:hypothetical protein